jgi:hypothetical protein
MSAEEPSRYHVVRAASAMALGGLAVMAGGLFLVMLVVSQVRGNGTGWSVLWWVLVTAGVVLGVGLLRALWRLARPPVGIRLDERGYTIDPLVGAGVRSAAWSDVVRVEAVQQAGQAGAVVHLRDGGTARIVARMVAEPSGRWLRDFDARLNQAHGQRRL